MALYSLGLPTTTLVSSCGSFCLSDLVDTILFLLSFGPQVLLFQFPFGYVFRRAVVATLLRRGKQGHVFGWEKNRHICAVVDQRTLKMEVE